MQRKLVRIFLSLFVSALCSYAVQAYVIHEDYKLVEDKMEAWHMGTTVNLTSGCSIKFSITIPTGQVFDEWRFYKNIGLGSYQSYETLGSDNPITIAYNAKYENAGVTWYLVPCFKQMAYVLSYDANEGEWTSGAYAVSTNKYSAKVTAPSGEDIERGGYELAGWGKTKKGSALIDPGEEFDGSDLGIAENGQGITLYAQWNPKSYTATIAPGEGGSGGSEVTYTYSEQQQTKAITSPTRTGHYISGWTVTDSVGSAPTIQSNILTIPAGTFGDFTMTPTWKPNLCSLRVVIGDGIDQIACDFTRDGKVCHETTSYSTSYQVDFDTVWTACAYAEPGYLTNATCAASGKMTTADAVFAPTASRDSYPLRLTLGTGISNICYRVGVASEWSWTTNSIVVSVPFGEKWQAYAEAAEGYEHTATSREKPASGTMTTAGASFEPVGTVRSYVLKLEMTTGISKIFYRYGEQAYYDETTTSSSVLVPFGTKWSAYALAVAGCTTNETCAASGTMGAGGAVFRPRVNAKPFSLELTPGKGIATIFYKTNETQSAWCCSDCAVAVPVLYGDTWSAYATPKAGYTYTKTSETLPLTGVMTAGGDTFDPVAVPNVMTVRYEPNGSTDSRLMSDDSFTYDVPKALALNKYSKEYHVYYYSGGSLVDEGTATWKFTGWNSRADGSGDYTYADGAEVTNPCGSTGAAAGESSAIVLLYAQWSGGAVSLPLPKKDGYDFSGWYTALTGGQRVGGAGASFTPTVATKLYAHWRAHVTKLTFVVDGQEKTEFSHAVANGGKYGEFGSLPELTSDDPTKIFLGWSTEKEGGDLITDETEVNLTDETVMLYARWETVTYTITYVTNGGTINEYAKSGYSPGQAFLLPTDVTRTGRGFLGWYDNPTFEGERVYGITSADTGDKTFYAKWSAVASDTVTLTFVNVSGYTTNNFEQLWEPIVDETTPTLTQTYTAGASVTLPQALFDKEGLTQVCWRLAGDGTTHPGTWSKYNLGKDMEDVTQDLTFHTVWETNTYTVVYDGNGGGFEDTVTHEIQKEVLHTEVSCISPDITAPLSQWKRDGYTCVGWALTPTGHAVYAGGETNLTSAVKLYAVWEKNEESEAEQQSADKGQAKKTLATLQRSPFPASATQSQLSNSASSSYVLHFSPGAAVVNPQAMTNRTVSGSVELPTCLYTNVQGSTFAGWTYQGKLVENPFRRPDIAFDGQIVTVTAAWEPLECGELSEAVGLTNAVLTCDDKDKTWSVCKQAKEVHSGTTCLKVTELDSESTSILQMCANGSGLLTYQWKTDDIDCPVSIIVDGVSYAVVATEGSVWKGKSLPIAGASVHTIKWYVPQHTGYPNFWLDDVRWEPEQPTYELTAAADPAAGGTVSVNGKSFESGSTATLTAKANQGYTFVQWNDGSTNLTHDVTVWGDITNYVARFEKVATYRISVTAVPSEGGTVTGQGDYPIGTTTNLTATANDGWTFLRWSDGSTDTNHEIRVISDATYTALFTNICEVTASANPNEGGTVTGGGKCVAGTEATLTAEAKTDWSFDHWSDGATENPHTITVLCPTNLTATFVKSEPPPTPGATTNYWYVAFDGNGATSGAMAEQTNVCGVATNLLPNAFVRTGYTFDGWTDKNGNAYADGTTVMDLATTNRAALLKAIWKPVEYTIGFNPNGGTGTMGSVGNCRYGVSYQLPNCTFECAKMSFAGWATNVTGAVVYKDGEIVRDLSATGGVVTLYAVWAGQGQAFVYITGHSSTKYYTGRPLTIAGYDADIPSEGYYEKDFTTVPGTVTTITETNVKYDGFGNVVKYDMGLTADSFSNKVASVKVLFEVKEDGWLKILPSRVGGEPGDRAVSAGGLSRFDVTVEYGSTFDVAAISNDFANAYGSCEIAYGALESGPWSADAPTFAAIGTTSFWYRVTAANLEPFVHEVAVTVMPRDMASATVDAIPDQTWTGSPITPKVSARVGDTALVEGVDYYLTYADNTDPGEATACAHGMGNYTGTKTAHFRIVRIRDIDVATIAPIADQTWTGSAVAPKVEVKAEGVTLAEGADYNLTYADNTDPGEATVYVNGTNSWRGTISSTFKIIRKIDGEPGPGKVPEGGLSKFDVTAGYDDEPHSVDVEELAKAYADIYADVRVTFAATAEGPWGDEPIAITDVGSTSLWYRVTANYCTTFAHEAKVTVTPRDLANVTVAAIPDQTWTGKAITPSLTVTDGSPSIVTANDYDVEYADNIEVGEATVTLTGKRNYAGTKTAAFAIVKKGTLVTIVGHVVTNAYDGKAHTASGYDFVSTNAAYTAADFRCTAGTSVSRKEIGTSAANLKAEDFENRNPAFVAEFVVAQDISVTVVAGTISGEPGSGKIPAGGASKFDTTAVYDGEPHAFDAESLTNAFAGAGYVVTNLEYAATAGGPWGSEPPTLSDAGSTSFWYRVSCENYEPFVHEAKVTVTPCASVEVSITGHVATNVYDGLPHAAEGYDVSIAGSSLYSKDDFAFEGTAYAERTKPGVSRFGLKSSDFCNTNGNFSGVTFVIARDGESAVVWDEPPSGVGEVGRYYGYALAELGFTDLADAVSVKADGLPAGLSLKKANVNGYWYVEGIPTATASTNDGQCAYLRITRKVGTAKVEEIAELPIEVREARVREIEPSAVLGGTYAPTPIDELWPEVEEAVKMPKDWSFSGWPTGIKYTTRDVRNQAAAYEVYGKATRAGVFTVTATRTVQSAFTTTKYREKYYASFMTEPEKDAGVAYTSQAYAAIASVTWAGVTSVSGLPTGLKFKNGEVSGTPTKAGVFAVTQTLTNRTKKTLLWQILPGENSGATVDFGGSKTEAGIVQVELGLPITWTLTADAGAKVTVSGLPTGLSCKNGVISGVPTRAANYTVTVKTVANGVTVTQRFAVKATALPTMMVGTYYGAATNELGTAEQFTLTLAAAGKVSGNFYMQGKRIAFSAASLESHEADGSYVAKITYKYDGDSYADELVLATTNAVMGVDLWQVSLRSTDGVLVGVDAQRDAVKAVGGVTAGNYTVMAKTEDGEYLTARVTTAGAVTVSGKLLNHAETPKLTSVSCSTRLMVLGEDRFGCWVTIYKTVSRQPPITYVQFWEMD